MELGDVRLDNVELGDVELGDMELGEKTRIRVLLVEDEILTAEWAADCLTEQGFVVRTASNATDALRQLGAGRVDVLFTDINLPGAMDGVSLARCARELQPDLCVIYASALVAMLPIEARVPGAVLLPKPYEPESVGRIIAGAVRSEVAAALP
jgi:CheY-like chemotaxis protein